MHARGSSNETKPKLQTVDLSVNIHTHVYINRMTEWGVVICVFSMAFLCGSKLVKALLLQAGTVVI